MTSDVSPVALITGAARRIGATIARHLHNEGYRIIIHYQQSEREAEALADELNQSAPCSAITVRGNLNEQQDINRIAKLSVEEFGRLDVLVNNASTFYPTPLGEINQTHWDDLTGSNVRGPLFLTQALAPALKQSGGCVVNLVDMHIDRPLPQHSVYCLAKSALASLTRSLASELAPDVRVNGIAPGAILWPERELSDEEKDHLLKSIPLGRLGSPEVIADAACFLINADYVTGQVLYVDGGRSIGSNASA